MGRRGVRVRLPACAYDCRDGAQRAARPDRQSGAVETEYAIQRGEVANPATETLPDRDKVFLFSAITRPANSGGPIVAGDGRIIGLVVEDSAEAASSESGPESAPFHRGIPSSEVIRALDDLQLRGIIKTEREPKMLELKLTFPNGRRRFVDDAGDGPYEPGDDASTT